MYRYDIINALIRKNKYKTYLEIGVRDNHCFNKINIKDKSGVDPMKDDWEVEKGKTTGWDSSKVPVKYRMTSDEYFEKYNTKYDIIFIDGLHENEQVYRDIQNSLNCLNKGGTILMHDCLPEKEEHQSIPRVSNHWNGDVWKAYVRIRNERKDIKMCVANTDTGVGIIKLLDNNLTTPAIKGKVKLDWKNYLKNKEEWMNIKSISEIVLDIGEENFKEEGKIHKRVQNFLHSGSLGDIIFSLPLIIKKGGGNLYIKNKNQFSATNQQYKSLYKLLKSQPYIHKVILYDDKFGIKSEKKGEFGMIDTDKEVKYNPNIELDFDLDYFRLSPQLREEHVLFSYFRVWNENPQDTPFPFLVLKEDYNFSLPELQKKVEIPKEKYNVYQITQRYRDGVDFDWKAHITKQKNKNYFIGVKSEYDAFIQEIGSNTGLIYYGDKVENLFDMAILIKHSNKFFCNPSVGQALAVGMYKEYYIAINPELTAAITGLPIENILNKNTGK